MDEPYYIQSTNNCCPNCGNDIFNGIIHMGISTDRMAMFYHCIKCKTPYYVRQLEPVPPNPYSCDGKYFFESSYYRDGVFSEAEAMAFLTI